MNGDATVEANPAIDLSDQSAARWTGWIRDRVKIEAVSTMSRGELASVQAEVAKLASQAVIRPHRTKPSWLSEGRLTELAEEAQFSLRGNQRFAYQGKFNGRVGRAVDALVDEVDLQRYLAEICRITVDGPKKATYIGYLDSGQRLELHVDVAGFGDINILICLHHTVPDGVRPCSFVYMDGESVSALDLMAGDAVIFDGAFTPHGRTPVAQGEEVALLSLAFNAPHIKKRTRSSLPVAE